MSRIRLLSYSQGQKKEKNRNYDTAFIKVNAHASNRPIRVVTNQDPEFACYHSPVLKAAFEGIFIESQTHSFYIGNFLPATCRLMLQWLYSQNLNEPSGRLTKFGKLKSSVKKSRSELSRSQSPPNGRKKTVAQEFERPDRGALIRAWTSTSSPTSNSGGTSSDSSFEVASDIESIIVEISDDNESTSAAKRQPTRDRERRKDFKAERLQACEMSLIQLWVLADKLLILPLQNDTMHLLQKFWAYPDMENTRWLDYVSYMYDNTSKQSPLRQLFLDKTAFDWASRDIILHRADELPRQLLLDLLSILTDAVRSTGTVYRHSEARLVYSRKRRRSYDVREDGGVRD